MQMKIGVFAVSLLWLVNCAEKPKDYSPSKNLIVATVIPIGEIKPFSSRLGIGASLIDLLYRPLFRLSGDGKFLPDLARKLEWDEPHSSFRVVLSEEKADDVLFTFKVAKESKSGDFSESLKNLQMVEKVNPKEVRFALAKFDRGFQTLLTQLPIISSLDQQPTGDFLISSQKPEEVELVRKNPSKDLTNKIIIKQIPSPRRAVRELVAGNVDIAFFPDEGDFKVLYDIQGIKVGELKSRMLYVVLQNFLNNKKILPWKIINQRLDRISIANQLGESAHIPTFLPVLKDDPWLLAGEVDDNAPINGNLLQEFFSKEVFQLTFLGRQSRQIRLSRILKRHFEDLGIRLKLNELSQEEFFKKVIVEKDFDLVLIPYTIKDTLMSNYLIFRSVEGDQSLNLSGYSNSKVDKYFEIARHTRPDDEAKIAFSKAMQALKEDPPGLFLFWLKTPIVYRQSCTGFKFSSNEFFSSLKDVRCEPSAAN